MHLSFNHWLHLAFRDAYLHYFFSQYSILAPQGYVSNSSSIVKLPFEVSQSGTIHMRDYLHWASWNKKDVRD